MNFSSRNRAKTKIVYMPKVSFIVVYFRSYVTMRLKPSGLYLYIPTWILSRR